MRAAIAAGVALVAVVVIAVLVAVGGDGDEEPAGAATTAVDSTSTLPPSTTGPAAGSTTAPPTTRAGDTTVPGTVPPATAAPRTTVTAPPPPTTPGVDPNNPPVVTIGPPNPLQRFEAFYDDASGRFIASVPLTANVTDPEGDAFTVDWFSSQHGYIGSGQSITAGLSPELDASQPVITARATDATGAVGEGSIQIVIWIRSDE